MSMANQSLGDLPEWNLGDLYAGPGDAHLAADIGKAEALAHDFGTRYRGKLEVATDGAWLVQAVRDYEALSDLLGRIGSFAQLYYVGDTTQAARAKFYGDTSQKLTDISAGLIFFELELNRIPDAVMEKALTDKG